MSILTKVMKGGRVQKKQDTITNVLTTFKLDVVSDLSSSNVHFDSVVGFDRRIWVTNGPGIMGAKLRNTFASCPDFPDLAELVL